MRPRLSFVLLLPLAAGCTSRLPNDLVILEVPGAPRYAVSTEDGILALAEDDLAGESLPIVHWYRGDAVRDEARLEHRSDEFGLLTPRTARIGFSTFAASAPAPHEDLWIQVIQGDAEHRPELIA